MVLVSFGTESPVENWLIVQPQIYKPAFSEKTMSFFDFCSIDMKSIRPKEGQQLLWDPGQSHVWKNISTKDGSLPVPPTEGLFLTLAATYVEVDRWQKCHLEIKGDSSFRIFLDGNLIGEKPKTPLILTRGKHPLVIASFQERSNTGLQVSLHSEATTANAMPKISTDPIHNLTLQEALTLPRGIGAELAPDGTMFATINKEGGLDIRLLPKGQLKKTIFLNGRILSCSWSPQGDRLAVITAGEKTLSDLWNINLKNGVTKKALSGIEGMSGLHWLPDGKFIMFASRVPPPEKGP